MDEKKFLDEYLQLYKDALFGIDMTEMFQSMRDIVVECSARGNKVIFAGNGASAGIASHSSVDFTKQGGIRSINFNEAGLITCFANDYGYEKWVQKAIEFYAEPGDVVVLISSSGKSPNIVQAAKYARDTGLKLITFTGFAEDNPIKSNGDLNFWVNSHAYNII
ncbi:SIS domain-containing protein, partial [Candidatus Neomarinimicrobiota bacterium]